MIKKISDKINKMFQNLFITEDNEHPIFKDLRRSYKVSHEYREKMNEYIKSAKIQIINKETKISFFLAFFN